MIQNNQKRILLLCTLFYYGAMAMDQAAANRMLHCAMDNSKLDLMREALKAGADVNCVDHNGDLPLHNAVGSYFLPATEVLLKAGANVNAQNRCGSTPLHGAALHFCHQETLTSIMQVLVAARADVNAQNRYGNTPLHFARVLSTTQFLVGAGANLDIVNNEGLKADDYDNEHKHCDVPIFIQQCRQENMSVNSMNGTPGTRVGLRRRVIQEDQICE